LTLDGGPGWSQAGIEGPAGSRNGAVPYGVMKGPAVPDHLDGLPIAEFAFPGALRDRLVAAILDGSKVSTTSLHLQYELDDEPLSEVGERSVVIDSQDRPVAVIVTTAVDVVALADVDLAHALNEGEGHVSLSEWRAAHERFLAR
jgi:uncharacterized protein YhfF